MQNNWKEYANKQKPPVNTGRKLIPVEKYPQDLNFTKTIGGTTYVVKSYFNKNANECLLAIVSRLLDYGRDLSEQVQTITLNR